MTRTELTEKILTHKRVQGLSWKHIAEKVGGGSPILLTAALLGQMRLEKAQAEKAAALLGSTPRPRHYSRRSPTAARSRPVPRPTHSSTASTSWSG